MIEVLESVVTGKSIDGQGPQVIQDNLSQVNNAAAYLLQLFLLSGDPAQGQSKYD